MNSLRERLTFANVVSVIALFIALGGSSYAAFKLPKNSVGAKQLKKHSVTPSKVARATIARFRGATGRAGEAGARGPSDAYIYSEDTIEPLEGDPETHNAVANLALPAGSYVLFAKLLADNENEAAQRIDCTLERSLREPGARLGVPLDFMKLRLGPNEHPNLEFGNLSLTGAVTLADPDTVSVSCKQSAARTSPGITVGYRKLIAVQVGALHPRYPQ